MTGKSDKTASAVGSAADQEAISNAARDAGAQGLLFDSFGWVAAVAGVFAALGLAAVLAMGLKSKEQ